MSKQTNKINRKFLLTLFAFIIIASIIIGTVIFVFIRVDNSRVEYPIIFGAMLILLFVTAYFRNRIEMITSESYMLRIKLNRGKPIKAKHQISRSAYETRLNKLNYSVFAKDSTHTLFYRAYKDDIKRIFRHYILEVVVFVDKDQDEFYLETVDKEISDIQEKCNKENKRIAKTLVTQFKIVDELDESTKGKIVENIIFRSQNYFLSTINVGLHRSSNQAVMLYSDTYTPSLYYRHHIDQIKHII